MTRPNPTHRGTIAAVGSLATRGYVARSFVWIWTAARRPLLLAVGAQLVSAAGVAVVLLCGQRLASALLADDPPDGVGPVLGTTICIGAALFVSGLATVVDRESRAVLSEQAGAHFEREITDVASSVDYERFEQQRFNDLLNRAWDEGTESAERVVFDVLALLSAVATSIALVVVLVSVMPVVLPALVLITVPFVLAARASAALAFRADTDLTANDRLRFQLLEVLTGAKEGQEVRIFGLRRPLLDRWEHLYVRRLDRIRRTAGRRVVLNGAASLAGSTLSAIVLIVVVDAATTGRIELADGAVGVVALQQVVARLRTMAGALGSLRESALFLEDFEEFRTTAPDQSADNGTRATALDTGSGPRAEIPTAAGGENEPIPLPAPASFRFEQVSFRYPGTEPLVLDQVDLEIGSGEIVALVGLSGSGKSTLAKLAVGLYRPTTGRITWDGVDVADIDRAVYWRSLSAVFQNYAEYGLTARENVALGDHHRLHDVAAVAEAARRAGVAETIEALPGGYETLLNRSFDEGTTLSKGEWQRLAVARAFFRDDAPVLLLDEPASALDPLAEQELNRRLLDLCRGRSVLLISHRFSTVRTAHRICVLDGGRVAELGTHADLLAAGGVYAQLYRTQAAAYLDD